MMKQWDGYLGHLNEEEMQLFRHFYEGFDWRLRYNFKTKKEVNQWVTENKKYGWPIKVLEICEFMLLERMEREKEVQRKWELNLYRKLKRKFS